MPDPLGHSVDIPFSVPLTHRLRTTRDISGEDTDVLVNILGGGALAPARVLLIAESSLTESSLRGPSNRVQRIEAKLAADDSVDLVAPALIVQGGEAVKNSPHGVENVLEAIHRHHLDRRSFVVAIGGGAMLDAVGYAAAIAHRGIRLVRLPTTTLAQADSGVGVKNAINYFGKKNWVGTFAVPWAVINDFQLLSTLPDRDFVCGFSEAVKVSLLKDAEQFHWLREHVSRIVARDESVSRRAIHQSCMAHLNHITKGGDPFEMLEARPLDFGHWSAHRLESLANYEIRHGEAVAIGIAIDCIYSTIKHGLAERDSEAAIDCLRQLGLDLWHPMLRPVDRLLEGLEEFRQHLGGRLTVTMLRRIGDPVHVHQIDPIAMKEAIKRLVLRSN